jgi:hypothetical protein
MKTLFATLAAATAIAAVGAPAAAQSYGYDHSRYEQGRYEQGRYEQGRWDNSNRDRDFSNPRLQQLERRIEIGLRRGDLTRGEAYELRSNLRTIAKLEARYHYNGMQRWEQADLEHRYQWVETKVRRESRDNEYGYGYGHDRR